MIQTAPRNLFQKIKDVSTSEDLLEEIESELLSTEFAEEHLSTKWNE